MMQRRMRCGFLFGLLLAGRLAWAAEVGDMQVDQAWARAAKAGAATTAAYLRITNHGQQADRLLAVAVDVAERAELHEQQNDQGVLRMRQIPSLAIAAGDTVAMQPMGSHIMIVGVRQRLAAGEQFTLQLQFEHAGSLKVPVSIKPLDYLPGEEHHHHH